MKNNYDPIAKHYDFLSRLVFGKAQINAQTDQLKYLKSKSRILIVGGGTGWILEEITKRIPAGLNITYVEISAQMLEVSRKRNHAGNEVTFIEQDIIAFDTQDRYDGVLTPFLFDNFTPQTAKAVFQKLNQLLKVEGIWLYVDFNLSDSKGKWWRRIFLKLMYVFFRQISNVEAKRLLEMDIHFAESGCTKLEERRYYRNFIKSQVHQKQV